MQLISLKKTTQNCHRTVPGMIPLSFLHLSVIEYKLNIFQVKKYYGVVTVQDAGMKTVVNASTAKTNQNMVEVERKNRPVLNVNARI